MRKIKILCVMLFFFNALSLEKCLSVKKNNYNMFDIVRVQSIKSSNNFTYSYNAVIRGIKCIGTLVSYFVFFELNKLERFEIIYEDQITERIQRASAVTDSIDYNKRCVHNNLAKSIKISEVKDLESRLKVTNTYDCMGSMETTSSYIGVKKVEVDKNLKEKVAYNLSETVNVKNPNQGICGEVVLILRTNEGLIKYGIEIDKKDLKSDGSIFTLYSPMNFNHKQNPLSTRIWAYKEDLSRTNRSSITPHKGEEIHVDDNVEVDPVGYPGKVVSAYAIGDKKFYFVHFSLPIGNLSNSFNGLTFYPEAQANHCMLIQESHLYKVKNFTKYQIGYYTNVNVNTNNNCLKQCEVTILYNKDKDQVTLHIHPKNGKLLELSLSHKDIDSIAMQDNDKEKLPSYEVYLRYYKNKELTFSFGPHFYASKSLMYKLSYHLAPYCLLINHRETNGYIIVPIFLSDKIKDMSSFIETIAYNIIGQSPMYLSNKVHSLQSLVLYNNKRGLRTIYQWPIKRLYNMEVRVDQKFDLNKKRIYRIYAQWVVAMNNKDREEIKKLKAIPKTIDLPHCMNYVTQQVVPATYYQEMVNKKIIEAINKPDYHKTYGLLFLLLKEIKHLGYEKCLWFGETPKEQYNWPENAKLENLNEMYDDIPALKMAIDAYKKMKTTIYACLNIGELLGLALLLSPNENSRYSQVFEGYMREAHCDNIQQSVVFHAVLTNLLCKLGKIQKITYPLYIPNNPNNSKGFSTNLSRVYCKYLLIATPYPESLDKNTKLILTYDPKESSSKCAVAYLGFFENFIKTKKTMPFNYVVLSFKNISRHNSAQPWTLQKIEGIYEKKRDEAQDRKWYLIG